jgi:hypothetical protein
VTGDCPVWSRLQEEVSLPYLDPGNTTFRDAVHRVAGFQTSALKAMIKAVADYQTIPNLHQFRSLEAAHDAWRANEPNEYRNRMSRIQGQFDAELEAHAMRYPRVNHTLQWVEAVSNQLNEFKSYAVGDILQFRGNAYRPTLQACLARYVDGHPPRGSEQPLPIRSGFKPFSLGLDINWNPNTARAYAMYARYVNTRVVQYADGVGDDLPVVGPGAPLSVQSRGSAICTEFAYAAAHVLTDGRAGGPSVEVVGWRGGPQMAHFYVLVGRTPGNVNRRLPPPVQWGPGCVIVDPWLAALGHNEVIYQVASYPFPDFLNSPVDLAMVRP